MKWPSVPLREAGKWLSGGTPPRDDPSMWAGEIPWFGTKDLRSFDLQESSEHVAEAATHAGTRVVEPGAVLFAIRGMSLAKEFRVGVTGRRVAFNQDIKAIIPRQGLDGRFLAWFLASSVSYILDRVDTASHGTKRLPLERVEDMPVPLPPLAEQQRIAKILDAADALRARRRTALAQLDTLTQAIFLDMFGDPATNPKRWRRLKLQQLITDGPQNGLYKSANDYGSGTPILRIDSFYDGAVTQLASLKRVRLTDHEVDTYRLRVGDIVLNRVNSMEYLGKSAITPEMVESVVFESNMMRFAVDHAVADPFYVVQFLQTNFVKSQILTAAKHSINQSSINQKDVQAFHLNVPPLPLQHEFARRIAAVERLKTSHRASLAELDALFASLQHRAFRGEL